MGFMGYFTEKILIVRRINNIAIVKPFALEKSFFILISC